MMKIVIKDTYLKQMLKEVHEFHNDLPFLPERMRNKKRHNLFVICLIKKYVAHIRTLKQVLNHELVFKKVHRVTQLYQKAWLKPYIYINTK